MRTTTCSTNKYNKILDMFIDKEAFQEWMRKPAIIGDKVVSTDCHSLVIANKSDVDTKGFGDKYSKNLDHILAAVPNLANEFTIDFLKDCFDKLPKVPDNDITFNESICCDCDGYKMVTWTYEGSNNETYELDEYCPVCEGEGNVNVEIKTPNGRFVDDPEAKCRIGGCLFYANKIKKIIDIAELLDVKTFTHIYQYTYAEMNKFQVGNVQLIVMPCLAGQSDEFDKVGFKI